MNKILRILFNIPKNLLLAFILFYKACISPIFPSCCRFEPTCSQYGLECVRKFGFIKGIVLIIKRLKKCHPFGGRGYDPVPEEFKLINK